MSARATFDVRVELEEVQPDGSKCKACSDTIFLKAFKVTIYGACGRRLGDLHEEGELVLLCQSCGDAYREELEEP